MKFTIPAMTPTHLLNLFLAFVFVCFANSAIAVPLAGDLALRDVFVPPVTFPQNGTVWKTGQRHNVTWDASNPPKQITNGRGTILLGSDGITTPLILANDFDILLGRIEITVPWVISRTDYFIVLFGDSGNFSPTIEIIGADIF